MTINKKWTISALKEYGQNYLAAGVSSLFRINPYTKLPMYLSKAENAYLYDVSGKKYIDYFMGHGAILLGHKRPEIEKAITGLFDSGFFAEFDSNINIEFAKMITEIIPCAELVTFTNSGSESIQLAMRLARGFTKKDKIVRIDGHFHGHNDYVLSNNMYKYIDYNNPGDRTSKWVPFSNGVPAVISETIIIMPWNNIELFAEIVKREGKDIAGIIMDPIDYGNGCMTTTKEYLSEVNKIAHDNGIIVIYDEILSGFRTGITCAQGYYGVTPDICALGKAITNGIPLGIIAGKRDILSKFLDPLPVVHGGTFSGNRFGIAAGIASLNILKKENFYEDLFKVSDYLFDNLQKLFNDRGIPAKVQHLGCGWFIYFGIEEPLTSFNQFKKIDWDFTRKFVISCINEGLYFHTDFTVSAAHTKLDVELTLEKIDKVISKLLK